LIHSRLATKMSRHDSDHLIDSQMRDVPLPAGLLARVRSVGPWSDEHLDKQLRSVAVPAGLVGHIQQQVADEELDQTLRDVALPWGLMARLRMIPQLRSRSPLGRLAIAASLMLLVGGAYLSSLSAILASFRPGESRAAMVVIYDGPIEIQAGDAVPIEIQAGGAAGLFEPVEVVAVSTPVENVQLVNLDAQVSHGAAGQFLAAVQSGLHVGDNVWMLRWGPLGAPHRADDELPELETTLLPTSRGVPPPLVRAYDRRFLLLHGVHPQVVPDLDSSLCASATPLSTSTASYDLTARRVSEQRLPAADEIRVEDFLAAMDYRYPLPQAGRLGIRTAAGPSAFNRPQGAQGGGLLQIGVQAGDLPARTLPATHLTVALDVSSSMRWGGRLEMTRQALRQVIDHMGPRDRLSLIVFNEEIVQLVENAGREHADQVLASIDALYAGGGTNISAGLQQAISVAVDGTQDARLARRLVLITDGRAVLPEQTATQLCELLETAANAGLRMTVLDLGDQHAADPMLAQLAAAGRGDVRPAPTAEKIRWALVETMTGRSPVMAADAQLTVTFNPRAVAAYRLIGHEATMLTDLTSATVETDLRCRETASVLYEVWLKPNSDDNVAVAEVTWRDPGSGETKRLRQRVSRLQFAPSWAESPLSLQTAALAAETAEILRESPFTTAKSRSLQAVLEKAWQVNWQLADRPDFQRFVALVEEIERVRSGRGRN
jgi:Ca-activated chloride channel family protein